jgi:hypothetical protein
MLYLERQTSNQNIECVTSLVLSSHDQLQLDLHALDVDHFSWSARAPKTKNIGLLVHSLRLYVSFILYQ